MYDRDFIIGQIAAHQPPLYLYDAQRIADTAQAVRRVFPGFRILYSVKANPFPAILRLMYENGIGIDAASANEVRASEQAGFAPEAIYYSAPGKSDRDLDAGLRVNLIADSLAELRRIDALARSQNTVAAVGVRLNIPNPDMQNSRFEVMGGAASKFGVDLDAFLAAAPELRELTGIRITGIHVYFGSQLIDERLIAANFAAISRAALCVHALFPLSYVNYGGGFGVAYEDDEIGKPDLQKLAGLIDADEPTRAVAAKGMLRNIELGRYLVAEAGVFVTTVADVKHSGGKTFAILHGGMNAFFRPLFTKQRHQPVLLAPERPLTPVALVGNTCTPLDVLYDPVVLPRPEPGDPIVFLNAGAYGYSMSLLDFISFDKPAQVMIKNEKI